MNEITDNYQDHDNEDDERWSFGGWLSKKMQEKDVSIGDLVKETGITYTGIWNIVKGNTQFPRKETRQKLADALKLNVPEELNEEIEQESDLIPGSGLIWVDFSPFDLETVPAEGGVYVFYDITDRPVYVGKSITNVRARVKDHQTRFWFKSPLVERGALLRVSDKDLCENIEKILIKFLGKHALLNVKGVIRDENFD